MSVRRASRSPFFALSVAFALSVLAGTGLGFALTRVPASATVATGL